ncbi:hypothetical protein [Methylobacterium sp. E-045]|uniref:hypothetical protein n=1 Tax=Methylobacterium sp. E-045 TaxID=2836575 RepID=UPI001FB8A928|nr:hypothetical protein [Methylobacterium sp. E-045]MCJ2129216.1 hypothetical protein [Methylobacterium sp. E-045]
MDYRGSLGAEPGSLGEHVTAHLTFNTDPSAHENKHAHADSLGIAYTNQYDHAGSAFPIFVLEIWGDELGADAFEQAFDQSLAAGRDHLPVWIWSRIRAPAVENEGRFAAIQPLDTIRFVHSIELGVSEKSLRER